MKDIDEEEFSSLLETLMIVCNLTIAHILELKENLRIGNNPPACINQITAAFLKDSSSIPQQEMSVDYLLGFLIKFVEKHKSVAIIDLNDELKLYKAGTEEVLRPKTAVSKTNWLSETQSVNESLLRSKDERILQSQWSIRTEPVRTSRRQLYETKERRTKILKEIFTFYTKSSAVANVKKTFDAVMIEASVMNLSSLLRFVKDFSILVDTKKVKELFMKNAEVGKYLSFDKFIFILEEFAFEVSRERMSFMENDKILMGQKLEKLNQKLLLETDTTQITLCKTKVEKLTTAMKDLEEKSNLLKKAPSSVIFGEFYEFLGLDDLSVSFI